MARFYYEDSQQPWRPDSMLRRFLTQARLGGGSQRGPQRNSRIETRKSDKQVPRLRPARRHGLDSARDDSLRALDLGMGYGRNAVWLAGQGYRVEGWERDRRYVAEARRRARELKLKLVVRREDFTKGEWPGPYDVIVISQALHQVKRSAALRVLARAKKALVGGGRLFLLAKLTSDRHFQRVRRDPAWKQVFGRVLIYAVIFAIALPANNAAHAGGFALGFPLGYVFGREGRSRSRTSLYNASAAVLIAASLASIALSHVATANRQRLFEQPREDSFN